MFFSGIMYIIIFLTDYNFHEIKIKINNANSYLCNPFQIYKEDVVNSDSNLLPAYNSIKGTKYLQINKDIPPEPDKVENIPDDFPGFITNDKNPFFFQRKRFNNTPI